MTVEDANLGDMDIARAQLLELCSRLLLVELDPNAREMIRLPEILQPLMKLEPSLEEWLGTEPWDSNRSDDADADFCSLFVLSPTTSPCASAWFGDEPARIGSHFHNRVEAWSTALGIQLSNEPLGRVPSDHVAVLSGLLAHAILLGEAGAPLAEQIADEGLRPWVSRFVEAVLEKTGNPLYRAIVKLLDILVCFEEPTGKDLD